MGILAGCGVGVPLGGVSERCYVKFVDFLGGSCHAHDKGRIRAFAVVDCVSYLHGTLGATIHRSVVSRGPVGGLSIRSGVGMPRDGERFLAVSRLGGIRRARGPRGRVGRTFLFTYCYNLECDSVHRLE